MNYKILFLKLLADINLKRLVGVLLGFTVLSVGASSDALTLVFAGTIITVIEGWDLCKGSK